MTDEKFELSDGDKVNPFWVRFKQHLQSELNLARLRNDNIKATEQETAVMRGEIKKLKALIALGDDRPKTET